MPQLVDPGDHDPADIVADRKEPGRERRGEFGLHFARILVDSALLDVDVCFSLRDAVAPSRAPVRIVKTMRARSRRSISVPAGIIWSRGPQRSIS